MNFLTTHQSIHRVDPNVHISGYLAAATPSAIHDRGITRIVKLFADDPSYDGGHHRHQGVRYMVIAAEDTPDFDLQRYFIPAMQFIREGLTNREQILVHCHAGISRSSTIVLLHLMINRGMNLVDAFRWLKNIRPQVQPNTGFMQQLLGIDRNLRAARARRVAVLPERASGRPTYFWRDIRINIPRQWSATSVPIPGLVLGKLATRRLP